MKTLISIALLHLLFLAAAPACAQINIPKVKIDTNNTPLDPKTWNPADWIANDGTIFSGQSGRTYKIKYTIKNTTDRVIKLHFSPSQNNATLNPGQTTTCNSPAKTWGNEKTGIKYYYPKVAANAVGASKGSGSIRTIQKENGKYFIVERDDRGGIQIVP